MKKVSLKQFSIYSLIFLSGVVFTLLISSTYAANSYVCNASEITYDNASTTLNSNNINDAIDELADKANYGNVSASDVLSGKTALSKGIKINGSMVNRGAVTSTIIPGESYTIPAGYHDGKGVVTASANSEVYTFPSESIGSTIDLGANNLYRYVNADNVYSKGLSDGSSHSGFIKLGGAGTYNIEQHNANCHNLTLANFIWSISNGSTNDGCHIVGGEIWTRSVYNPPTVSYDATSCTLTVKNGKYGFRLSGDGSSNSGTCYSNLNADVYLIA